MYRCGEVKSDIKYLIPYNAITAARRHPVDITISRSVLEAFSAALKRRASITRETPWGEVVLMECWR